MLSEMEAALASIQEAVQAEHVLYGGVANIVAERAFEHRETLRQVYEALERPPAVLGFRSEHHAEAAALVPNAESWLAFTDLVFVDPVGTGFSRIVENESGDDEKKKKKDEEDDAAHEYFGYKRDLE